MRVLLRWPLISILLLFSSCAKLKYVWDQGRGQFSLLTNARPNQDVLNDPTVSFEHKEKIKIIERAKQYFYNYFEINARPIYSKTVMLNNQAVTYLVLATAPDDLVLKEECFPFAGCFPYLGFFDLEKAKIYEAELGAGPYVTRIRPVLAYSTLGNFSDPILSSFFYFEEIELVEMIFHELFHTLFFVTNEVDLNESLANWMARALLQEYLANEPGKLNDYLEKEKYHQVIRLGLKKLAEDLSALYQKERDRLSRHLSKVEAQNVSQLFWNSTFPEGLEKLCRPMLDRGWSCTFQNKNWNNPALAEFLLYEEKAEKLLMLQKFGRAKDFYMWLKKRYDKYRERGHSARTFEEYLSFEL